MPSVFLLVLASALVHQTLRNANGFWNNLGDERMWGSARKIWTKVLVFYYVLVFKMKKLLGNTLKISYFKIVKHKLSLYLVLSCQDSKHLMFWDTLYGVWSIVLLFSYFEIVLFVITTVFLTDDGYRSAFLESSFHQPFGQYSKELTFQ